jgi:hypothetical protein
MQSSVRHFNRWTTFLAFACVSLLATGANAAPYNHPVEPVSLVVGNPPVMPWMAPQAIELVVNGGFESGPAGWTILDEAGGSGSWYITSALAGPVSGLPLAAPPEGVMQAASDQTGPGSHIMFQDVAIPALSTATLNLVIWYVNSAVAFYDPASLSYNTIPNQQFRIDIMNPAAPIDDLGAGVLLNVYKTTPINPPTLPYTPISANLNAFAGQTIRLRFTEVDNQLYFNVGVDAVSIEAEPIVPAVANTWGAIKHAYR